jgi:hypothetical protein
VSDKHAQMREMARDLIRDSAIEDAIAQKIAQIIEFIHEDRIKPLEAKLAKAVKALESICFESVGDEGIYTARATLEELKGDKP